MPHTSSAHSQKIGIRWWIVATYVVPLALATSGQAWLGSPYHRLRQVLSPDVHDEAARAPSLQVHSDGTLASISDSLSSASNGRLMRRDEAEGRGPDRIDLGKDVSVEALLEGEGETAEGEEEGESEEGEGEGETEAEESSTTTEASTSAGSTSTSQADESSTSTSAESTSTTQATTTEQATSTTTKKVFNCVTAIGAGCKTCMEQAERTSDNHCKTCNDGYEKHGTSCKAFDCTTGIPAGCATCEPQALRTNDTTCASCIDGYYSVGASCEAFGCTTADGTGCKSCVSQSSRESDTDCGSCHSGHVLVGTNCEVAKPAYTFHEVEIGACSAHYVNKPDAHDAEACAKDCYNDDACEEFSFGSSENCHISKAGFNGGNIPEPADKQCHVDASQAGDAIYEIMFFHHESGSRVCGFHYEDKTVSTLVQCGHACENDVNCKHFSYGNGCGCRISKCGENDGTHTCPDNNQCVPIGASDACSLYFLDL